MRRCAFLTLDDPTGFVIDDPLAYAPLARRGWRVEMVPWRQPAQAWSEFEAVVIRSPWDYHHHPEEFQAVLETIEQRGVPLFNSVALVKWNTQKTYLRELAERGVAVVPTQWRERLAPGELTELFASVGDEEMVVKPVIGAGADGAFRLNRFDLGRRAAEVETYFADRALMAQPFVPAVLSEGELSLFYFNGGFSHAILKVPKPGDFRVQEEHGGEIQPAQPDSDQLRAGEACLKAIPETPLYARVDLVRAARGGGWWLMELELIEPSLYLRMHPEAPERFASAFVERLGS